MNRERTESNGFSFIENRKLRFRFGLWSSRDGEGPKVKRPKNKGYRAFRFGNNNNNERNT